MQYYFRHLITAILGITVLQSCIVTTTVEEINDTVWPDNTSISSKSNDYAEGSLVLKITNNANNTRLIIDSLEIYNIKITKESAKEICTGNKMLLKKGEKIQIDFQETASSDTINLPEQKFHPWSPKTLPANSTGTYIKIYGQICTFIGVGEPFTLTEGPLYFPFIGNITPNHTTSAEFQLYVNCPLYCQINDQIELALVPITFDASVEGWN